VRCCLANHRCASKARPATRSKFTAALRAAVRDMAALAPYSLLLLATTAATTVMSSGLPPDVARPLQSWHHNPLPPQLQQTTAAYSGNQTQRALRRAQPHLMRL
jgi:hypothetical protein